MIGRRCRALLVALAIDWVAGELPNRLHPVVWLGRWIALGERWVPRGDRAQLMWGAGWLAAGSGLAGSVAALLPRRTLVQSAVASTLLAYRALDRAAAEVEIALRRGELDEARRVLGWHLVSRPTTELRADEVAAAAIESLAENLSDSVVAPLMAYAAGGLPGLAVYRLCNTADAMWGYHTARFEWLGKAAAHADDVLNLVPSRATALLLALASQLLQRRAAAAWRVARRDHARTASPNAGWPMAAIAGALDTTLAKRGQYTLGDGERLPDAALLREARWLVRVAVTLLMVALAAIQLSKRTVHEDTRRRAKARSFFFLCLRVPSRIDT